ncbi:AI-2E family transporter [Pleomorphovibrio marinus]|uniref:AI-2E family transporter n=1 Tax=Pleomorphovibrio marinus TaxID=2164132 RepID=UPI000E0A237F|nr:AI-2E family transporter [Pleomorphovibrio marinus]
MSKIILPGYLKTLVILLLIIVIIFVLIVGRSLLIPLMLGGYIAILMIPLCNWMENRKVPRVLSAFFSLLLSIITISGIITLIVVQVSNFSKDLEDVSERMNNYIRDVDKFATEKLDTDLGISDGISKNQLFEFIESNSESVSDFVLNTLGSLTGVVLVPVFIFFMLIYRDHLEAFVARFFKEHNEEEVKDQIRSLRKVVQFYIIGVIKVMGILAILNTAALWIIGVKHALFFGILAALFNIIPYLGPFLGAILPFIFAFLTMDGLIYPFAVVISFTIIQMFESNFLTPKIVGSNVNLNALITFMALLVGGAIWGVAGMILIIPTLAILKRIFDLSESTKPFSYLLGEDEDQKK